MAQRPYSTLHSPDDVHRFNQAQASQYSLHTPTDTVSPHSFRSSPPPPPLPQQQQSHHLHTMDTTEYQLTDYPSQPPQQQQPQQQPQPDPHLHQQQQQQQSYVASPTTPTTPRFSSPPPAFDSQYPNPRTHASPPTSPTFAPPPTSPTFAPPPTSESTHPVPTTINALPVPPEPIQAPTYNPSHDTPHTPKTPVYTPGGASGPNGGVHAPGQIGHPNQQHGREEYHHGLCDCFSDFSTCCVGYWCPCILYSRTYHRLKTSPNSNLNDFHNCNGHCITFCVLGPISWIFSTLQRTRIREKYRLEGSLASDCGKAYCCVMCTLVQDEREVRDREDERRRFAGPGSGVVGDGGYRRQDTMVYGRS